jgi:hypothetical protein
MKIEEVITEATAVRNYLKENADFTENPIDTSLPPVRPFGPTENVRLIVLAQDPTIQNAGRRSYIDYTLNLDKNGSLNRYITQICDLLAIPFDRVYATNIFKYFYTIPPASTMNVLQAHLKSNVSLLKKELADFPGVPIVTLGEPVLQLLTNDSELVRNYWGYNGTSNISNGMFRANSSHTNLLQRSFYPLPHIKSVSKMFYANTLENYVSYIKTNCL